MTWNHPYYPMQGYAPGYEESWSVAYPYAYVGQGTQSGAPLPPSDPSHSDPRFTGVYQTAVQANAAEYSTNTVVAHVLSSHAGYEAALSAVEGAKGLWTKVAVDAQGIQTTAPADPLAADYATKFKAQATYRLGQLEAQRQLVLSAQGKAPPPGPQPADPNAPPEPLSAGMAAGWLVAIAAVGFIFFRVAILKRPL